MGLAHQGADGAVQHDLGRGVAMDAHLVLQTAAVHAVARTDRAVSVDVELGHDEQGDALRASGSVGQACQHQVDDVVGHVVLAGRDEDLLASDLVGAVALGLSLGAQQAQVGAAMRFGQAHGAGPLARGQLGQVGLFLLVGTVGFQAGVGAVAQAGVHGPGLVGRVQHFIDGLVDQDGQALAAPLRIRRQGRPAVFGVLLVGFLETIRRLDFVGFLVQDATLGVAHQVQRRQHFGGELATLFEHGVDGVGIHIAIGGDLLEFIDSAEQLVDHELHVAQGGGVRRHREAPRSERHVKQEIPDL